MHESVRDRPERVWLRNHLLVLIVSAAPPVRAIAIDTENGRWHTRSGTRRYALAQTVLQVRIPIR